MIKTKKTTLEFTQTPQINSVQNWENAYAWITTANHDKNELHDPLWAFDCNFKLDYDGPLLHISSRFYPPHKNGGNYWQGSICIMSGTECLTEKEIKADTINEIKSVAEVFVNRIRLTLQRSLIRIINDDQVRF